MRDIIVIGASAGGVEELIRLSRRLPPGLPAAIFVVLHISPDAPGLLPKILQRRSSFKVKFPQDQEPVVPGTMYIASPDHHLVLSPTSVHLSHGPKVNRMRPSVDTLFCSAARAFGSRVIGVILSGTGSDGTYGLQTIKESGGITIVQDPEEALFTGMPSSALEQITVDYVTPVSNMIPLFEQLVSGDLSPNRDRSQSETRITKEQGTDNVRSASSTDTRNLRQDKETFNQDGKDSTPRTLLTCPECGGVLWETTQGKLVQYACQIGHTFSEHSLYNSQGETLEEALWMAVRTLDERATLSRRLAHRAGEHGHPLTRDQLLRRAEEAEKSATVIREIVSHSKVVYSPDAEATETLD